VPFAFTFDWILARGDQHSSILVLAYNPSLASTIKRLPADDGNGSYLSSGVLIAVPRFSTTHRPGVLSRTRQMSFFPCPPIRFEPKYSQPRQRGAEAT